MRHIALGHLEINAKGRQYVNDALDRNRLSKGKYTIEFEKQFSALHGCKHGIFLNSGTSALQVALAALKEVYGYQDGDEVIVPAVTFIATSNVVLQNNLKPVFVDVDPVTFNIDANKVEAAITEKTRCIIPVHLFGLPADMYKIKHIADFYNLQIIEDSCETMFASQYGRSVGSFGDLACFSTYVNHLIVGGVGGLITTNNTRLMEICRSLMAHGRDSIYTDIDADDGLSGSGLQNIIERRFRFERVGYSYRATELEAAIALSELENWEMNILSRRVGAYALRGLLKDIKELQTPVIPDGYKHSFMMYPMVLNIPERDDFLMHLEKNKIETRYLLPLLNQPIYEKLFPGEMDKHPVAKRLSRDGFFIGMHQGLTGDDIKYISDVIHDYFGRIQ